VTGHAPMFGLPVRFRQSERALGGLAGRALVTKLTMSEPGQQVRLHDRGPEDRDRAIENTGHRQRLP
jgi:hypothetical protein